MWSIVANAKRHRRRYWIAVVGTIGVLALLIAVSSIPRSARPVRAATGEWPTYLGNDARQGFNGTETIINPSTAPKLKIHWVNQAAAQISSEPIEANSLVYWGSWDGLEHATNPSTGVDAWTQNLGQTSSCTLHPHGIISTATVASVSIGEVPTKVLFVGGGDAQLYALDATGGAILWHTSLGSPPNDFIYSSPAVYNGSVYIGVSSYNDCPEVRGRMVQVNASTGTIQHVFYTAPSGCIGGGVWGSPAIDTTTGILYFATGDLGPSCGTTETMVSSLIALQAKNLSFVGSWQVPGLMLQDNFDFGNTPTFFKATIGGVLHKMIGITNKNGTYYAFDRTNISAGPMWTATLAEPGGSPDNGMGTISSSSWDGTNLYAAGAVTTINGQSCAGSLRALNPTNGAFPWELC